MSSHKQPLSYRQRRMPRLQELPQMLLQQRLKHLLKKNRKRLKMSTWAASSEMTTTIELVAIKGLDSKLNVRGIQF